MTELSQDHMHLLALARTAIAAEQGPIWRKDPEEAVGIHSEACNALWEDLRRQIDIQDGKVPVLEHPTVKQRELARRMKRQIIDACIVAVESAIEDQFHAKHD
ncbi:hypothetical protein [Gemmobacter denitrificans]|uniref:Phage protein n=1 Tax=Gemmobacter denitrificans TaxID=3123040 RepID=A0ABU8BSG8_9RHOB